MSASANDIARLRRMTAEPTTTTYSDIALAAVIEQYPIPDSDGYFPDDDDWTSTYDLHAAAAEIWEEKQGLLVNNVNFSADGGNFSDSQKFEQAGKMVRFHLARRKVSTIRLQKWPREDRFEIDDDND